MRAAVARVFERQRRRELLRRERGRGGHENIRQRRVRGGLHARWHAFRALFSRVLQQRVLGHGGAGGADGVHRSGKENSADGVGGGRK